MVCCALSIVSKPFQIGFVEKKVEIRRRLVKGTSVETIGSRTQQICCTRTWTHAGRDYRSSLGAGGNSAIALTVRRTHGEY